MMGEQRDKEESRETSWESRGISKRRDIRART